LKESWEVEPLASYIKRELNRGVTFSKISIVKEEEERSH
jgi:hypothetical protein